MVDLRRFSSDILPFLCVLVIGELQGDNTNAFAFFSDALQSNGELKDIARVQKSIPEEYYSMYLVNFHDYVDAVLHVNVKAHDRNASATYTQDFIKVRKLLAHLELDYASPSNFIELHNALHNGTLQNNEGTIDVLMRCLHTYFTHVLILNIELQKVIKTQYKTRVCIAPEIPQYLADAMRKDKQSVPSVPNIELLPSLQSMFAMETSISYDTLLKLPQYSVIRPIIDAYLMTAPCCLSNMDTPFDNYSIVMSSEIWRKE